MRFDAVLAFLLVPSLALAQPSYQPPVAPARPIEVAPIKSEETATALAVGGTLGGFALAALALKSSGDNPTLGWAAAAGLLVGPSLGHVYTGDALHAVGTSVLRAGGGLSMLLGVFILTMSEDCFDDDLGSCGGDDDDKGHAMLWIGAAAYLGATAYDIIDASYSARRANARHARSVMLTPSLVSTAGGGSAPALSLTGRF